MTPERWEQVGKLYQAALALPPSEREIFLDDACGHDAAMRRELESLLAAEGDAGSFLAAGAMKDAAKMLVEDKSLLLVGKELGHYHLLSLLGSGGMGEVYLAEDTRLKRKVALKLLPAELTANQDRLRRFEQEAQAASALNHPNILTIHEIGEAEDRRFMAAEFVDGETLRSWILRGPLKIGEALSIAEQAASALAVAHADGIIHRDVKPENIMVRRDGIVKILDFGLAKLLDQGEVSAEDATRQLVKTSPGMVMGTVAYMSPEQARGLQVDVRTDIFSLGVLIYEMVAGRLPFEGVNTNEIMASILSDKEATPLARFARGVPTELERIIEKSLRKDREKRYQTIKDMLLDLKSLKQQLDFTAELERSTPQAITGVEAGSTATPTTLNIEAAPTEVITQTLTERIKDHKRSLVISLAVISVTVVGLAYMFYVARPARAIDSIAVLPLANASNDPNIEYLSDGISESLINSLTELGQLKVIARATAFRYKGKEIDPQTVGRELNVRAVLMGRVRQMGDTLNIQVDLVDATTGAELWGADYERKVSDVLSIKQLIAQEVTEKLRLRLSGEEQRRLVKHDTTNAEAYRAYLRGIYYWNKGLGPGFEKSREYFQQAIDLDPSYARAYAALADYYGFAAVVVGLLPPNEAWPKVEAATNKALALDATLAEPYNPLAALKLYYYRDWPAAERAFRRGIELNPKYAEIHGHYSLCLMLFGRNQEGLAEAQRSVELDPLSPRFNYFWGRSILYTRQYDRAIEQYRKTLELDPNYVPAHEDLGDAFEQKGMQREAIAEWSKALTLRGAGEQASDLERTYAASGFGAAVRALAKQQLEKLNERMKRGEYVPAAEYVTAYTRLGDKEQAFAWLDKAFQESYAFVLIVRVHPVYDQLRDDPRFADLLSRVGLHQ